MTYSSDTSRIRPPPWLPRRAVTVVFLCISYMCSTALVEEVLHAPFLLSPLLDPQQHLALHHEENRLREQVDNRRESQVWLVVCPQPFDQPRGLFVKRFEDEHPAPDAGRRG